MPGYTGHIKGLVSENLFAGSYANCTSKAIGKKHAIGYDLNPKNRFNSLYTSAYKSKNFRRFADRPSMQPRKDYDDYLRFVNDTYAGEMLDFMNNSGQASVEGSRFGGGNKADSSSRNSLLQANGANAGKMHNRTHSTTVKSDNNLFGKTADNFAKFKPDLLDDKTREQFFNMSDGFKKIFPGEPKDRKMVIPIAGYGGHRRGDRS